MPIRLLAVGDIHLGRLPTRVPDALRERLGEDALTPGAAWRGAVEQALDLEVDAVLLAGDVVEQNDDFYEAYPSLRAGVETLAGAGIAVLGVAGNHDDEVLPRLADTLEAFRLVGRGGAWEQVEVRGADGTRIDILGWSFPEARVRTSPLESLPSVAGDRAVVGLLHCDRDQSSSPYAPVRAGDLEAAPVDAWLLGHVHQPDALAAPRPVGYLGSLSALDPGETGARGPWLVEVAHRGAVDARQLPIAPLRFERLEVSLEALEAADAVHERIVQAIAALDDAIALAGASPRAVGCRVVLTGRSALRGQVERALASSDPTGTVLEERAGIAYFVESWRNAALPAIDLEEAARGVDPVAMLARRVLVLRRGPGDPAWQETVEPARERLAAAAEGGDFSRLEPLVIGATEAAARLERAALRALDALLAQQGR